MAVAKAGMHWSAIRYGVRHPLRQWGKGVGHLDRKKKTEKKKYLKYFSAEWRLIIQKYDCQIR
jgi:hypothetical protein